MKKRNGIIVQEPDLLAPRPVHLTTQATHGLFGSSYLTRHMMIDNKWSPDSLIEEYKKVSELLQKHAQYNKHEKKKRKKSLISAYRILKQQIQDGRVQLQKIKVNQNVYEVTQYLKDHIDLLRMYINLPVEQIVEKINQQTFLLRKEYDRLEHRMEALEQKLYEKLEDLEIIKYRIKQRLKLTEDIQINVMKKNLQNSELRLRAFKCINKTYREIIRTLHHDEIYHEHILRALEKDLSDQDGFMKHIIYLTEPAFDELHNLKAKLRSKEGKSRKSMQTKEQYISGYRQDFQKSSISVGVLQKSKQNNVLRNWSERYERRTASMMELKDTLNEIELDILQIQPAAVCSKPELIFATYKFQTQMSARLRKHNALEDEVFRHKIYQKSNASVKKKIVQEHYQKLSEFYGKKIKHLEEKIAEEDRIEQELKTYIKNSASAFSTFRFGLWNLYDILRHVRVPKDGRIFTRKYPVSYLALPLYKYEMAMRAAPPVILNEDMNVVYNVVYKKLKMVMTIFDDIMGSRASSKQQQQQLQTNWEKYHEEYVNSVEKQPSSDYSDRMMHKPVSGDDDDNHNVKEECIIPTRECIKRLSAKVIEERTKIEE